MNIQLLLVRRKFTHNQWGFPYMDPIFTEFSEFRETDKITEAWMRVNLMILSVTYVFVALWYHLCLSGKGSGFCVQQFFLFLKNICHWIQRIQWNHLGKTQLEYVFFNDLQVLDLRVNTKLP